jgi:hypothetical protein
MNACRWLSFWELLFDPPVRYIQCTFTACALVTEPSRSTRLGTSRRWRPRALNTKGNLRLFDALPRNCVGPEPKVVCSYPSYQYTVNAGRLLDGYGRSVSDEPRGGRKLADPLIGKFAKPGRIEHRLLHCSGPGSALVVTFTPRAARAWAAMGETTPVRITV